MTAWHVLDARSIWIREFASALSQRATVYTWTPRMSWTGILRGNESVESLVDPPLQLRHFPLQRGYARSPISAVVRLGSRLKSRLERQTKKFDTSVLICTTPYYAAVAERWRGPVVYYQTDLTVRYDGVNPAQIRRLDAQLCRRADLVCPNSERIRAYMIELGCPASKISVVPNATRESNILSQPDSRTGPLPSDAADLPRPIAGVIGNLAANMDWLYLREVIRQTPNFSWLFVGPTDMEVRDAEQNKAREVLLGVGGRVRFLGSRPYGSLQRYARAFDVAVLPYKKHEPTYSGSSTRFYEHLAACRPMLATRGFAELLEKEPLLHLSDEPAESAVYLAALRDLHFVDGYEHARWEASRSGTWESRVLKLTSALADRCLRVNEPVTTQAIAAPSFAASSQTSR